MEADKIDEVLGWAYIEHDKHQPIWKPARQKLRSLQTHLMSEAMDVIELEADARFLPRLQPTSRRIKNASVPDRSSSNEVWINLTSPLKHQIQSMVFTPIDEALDILSVNALRYDGQGWYCATTDGEGVVHVASYFGIDAASGAILGINGSGGAARYIGSAWMKHGGRIVSIGGKRQLPATLVNGRPADGVVFDLIIDTDGSLEQPMAGTVQLNPFYFPLRGSIDERMEISRQQ